MFGRDSRYQDLFSSIKDIKDIAASRGTTEEIALTDYRERINELAGEYIRTVN